jgi:glycosyltransferase-like protein
MSNSAEIALVTYSTRPRGGVVHTLSLAEALLRQGFPIHVLALGDPETGFFRPVDVPHTIVAAPPRKDTLAERVFAAIDTLEDWLAGPGRRFGLVHTQDCIAASAAVRVRDSGVPLKVLRTVHHVDDFTTEALIDCQRRAILEPDGLVVVSEHWRSLLHDEYGVEATVISNGVDPARFAPITAEEQRETRDTVGAGYRFVLLSVGGVEPRKGSIHLFEAMSSLKDDAMLVVVGGETFQDYEDYRQAAYDALPRLGLELGRDVVVLGTVGDEDVRRWYRSADALAFPSTKEGFGLAVLEAASADLPVVASDLPVFREYLAHDETALLAPVGDSAALAVQLRRIIDDAALRDRLRTNARRLADRFTWDAAATRHRELYAGVRAATA